MSRKYSLLEMAILRKKDTKLPVNIWVDDAGTYLNSGHYKRIKFQKDYENYSITNNFAIMKLSRRIVQSTLKGNKISNEDIKKVRNFVLNNFAILNELSDANISIFEFKELMIPSGEEASSEDIEAQRKLLQQYLN